MFEMQKDGTVKPRWFKVPTGKCWIGGVVAINGKCVCCGCKPEDHRKET